MKKYMKRISTILLLFFVSVISLYAQYEPKAKGQLITHKHYCLDYNKDSKQADWTYYVMTKENLSGVASRKDNFRKDPTVKVGSAELSDYSKSGYDRGHLVPAASMTQSAEAMSESFYLSNMSPQHPSCNRGIWKKAEEYVRGILNDTLYVVSGCIFDGSGKSIGANKVLVPSSYFKVAYDAGAQKMIAFIIPNEKGDKELQEYRCTVDEIESILGIDLFYQLDDALESRLESKIN